ncbi:MAG: hypothetical protein COB89_03795 [Piscirickettsiaceae bacterium]|nr:MAG: hypothetical protein COB89_03795 [Piscirickettsiaceae bacterium]
MLIKFLKPTLFLLLNCISWSAVSEDSVPEGSSWYSIEYIIFKINVSDNQNLELWTKEPFYPITEPTSLPNAPIKNTFKRLAERQKKLHGAYNRLKRLASYTPLKHGGWIQEAKEKSPLSPVYIKVNIENDVLEGSLTFHRERFLHLDLDVQLSQGYQPINSVGLVDNLLEPQPADIYRLQQTRRIKTGQLHYFDHPRFGVIAKIEKIDAPISTNKTIKLIDSLPLPEQNPAPFPAETITQ